MTEQTGSTTPPDWYTNPPEWLRQPPPARRDRDDRDRDRDYDRRDYRGDNMRELETAIRGMPEAVVNALKEAIQGATQQQQQGGQQQQGESTGGQQGAAQGRSRGLRGPTATGVGTSSRASSFRLRTSGLAIPSARDRYGSRPVDSGEGFTAGTGRETTDVGRSSGTR